MSASRGVWKLINQLVLICHKTYMKRINDIYIYIYMSLKKKPKTGYFRIINLFPSCFSVSGVDQKHEGKKYNRISSDPMDK